MNNTKTVVKENSATGTEALRNPKVKAAWLAEKKEEELQSRQKAASKSAQADPFQRRTR